MPSKSTILGLIAAGIVSCASAESSNKLRANNVDHALHRLLKAYEQSNAQRGRGLGLWPWSDDSPIKCPDVTCPEPVCNCPDVSQMMAQTLDICEIYGNDKCGTHGDCENTGKSYKCECDKGWGGKHCELKDLCDDDDTCKHATKCENVNLDEDGELLDEDETDTSALDDFRCTCESGWFGKRCNIDKDGYLDQNDDDVDDEDLVFSCPSLTFTDSNGKEWPQMEVVDGKCVDIDWCDEDRTGFIDCSAVADSDCVNHLHIAGQLELYQLDTTIIDYDGCEAKTKCRSIKCKSGYECIDDSGELADLLANEDITQTQHDKGHACREK
jgi:hypothetical protein